MASVPFQKVPLSKKKAKDFEHMQRTFDAYIESADLNTLAHKSALEAERMYHGIMDRVDYSHITNPYNASDPQYQRFPAKLQNMNIIKPTINLLLGEARKRNVDYQSVVLSPDAFRRKTEERKEVATGILQQMAANAMADMGMGDPQQKMEMPENLQKFMDWWDESYKDVRAIISQDIMDVAWMDLDMDDLFIDGFKNWLIHGGVYTYKGAHNDNPVYEVVPIFEISHHQTPGVKYIEDCDWVVRKATMSGHQLMDRFYEPLQKRLEQIDERPDGYYNTSHFSLPDHYPQIMDANSYVVYHIAAKTYSRVGFVDVVNEQGILETIEVDESYVPEKGVQPEWFWVNEVWEGYKVMTDTPFYFGIEALPVQRGKADNPSSCKLPYNGRVLSDSFRYHTSPAIDGKPYQILYNIYHYVFQRTMSKNKDKIALMDINMIPRKHGWDEDKFMYYADALGYAFVDPTGVGGEKTGFNQWQVLDMSLGKYIESILGVLTSIRMEYEETLGINRQRKGQSMASDGATVTERAVFQSNMVTEDIFARYDKFMEKELNGVLSFARYAWRKGKKGSYIIPDFGQMVYDIEPSLIEDSDIAVYIKMDSEENTKLATLRQAALMRAQNSSPMSVIADIIDANNMSKIKSKIRDFEDAQAEMQRQQAENQQEAEKVAYERLIEAREYQEKLMDKQLQNNLDVQDLKNIGSASLQKDVEADNRREDEKLQHDKKIDQKEIDLKSKEVEIKRGDLTLKRKKQAEDNANEKRKLDIMSRRPAGPKR